MFFDRLGRAGGGGEVGMTHVVCEYGTLITHCDVVIKKEGERICLLTC